MIERISILGTGLIGGSLGLAWQERRPDCTIVGHDRPEVLEQAEARGAIDQKAADPVTAVEGADLVVLATPLATVLRHLEAVADRVDQDAIVTDVGSVKQPVLDQAADVLPEGLSFVGGHPMAGAENAGIEHADPLLFENAVYVLCLPNNGEEAALFEIHRTVFYSHIEQIWGWDEDWQKANFARELESSTTSVVLINGLIVGYMQLCDDGRGIYLQTIALIANYQRKGIGTRLVKQLQTQAAAKGVPLELGVFRTNTSARQFYERLGFGKTYNTETHIQMSWKAI